MIRLMRFVAVMNFFVSFGVMATNYTLPNNQLPGCSLNSTNDTYTCPNGLNLGFKDKLEVTGNKTITINVSGNMTLGTRVRLNPNGQPEQLTISTTGNFTGGYKNEINANISSSDSLRIDNETPTKGNLTARNNLTLGFKSSLIGSATSLTGNVSTENEVDVLGDLRAAGNIYVAYRSKVTGNLNSGNNVSLDNEVALTGNIDSAGAVSMDFLSQITGSIVAGDDVTLQREVTVDGNINSPETVLVPNSSKVTGYVNASNIMDEQNVEGQTCDINNNIGPCSDAPVTPNVEPIGYWYFDELNWTGSTDEVVDQSGNNYNGQALRNASTSGFAPAIDADLGTCRYGKFNGDNAVRIPNATRITQAKSISVAFWFKGDASLQNDSESYQTLLVAGSGTTESSAGRFEVYRQDASDGGGLYFEVRLRNGAIVSVEAGNQQNGGPQLLDDNWHHLAATYSRSDRKLEIFIDGILIDQRTFNGPRKLNNVSNNLFIGGQATADNSFNGELDEVFISDDVMSRDDVLTLMLTTRPCADLRPQCSDLWPQGYSPVNDVPLPFDLPDRAESSQLPGSLQATDYLRVGDFDDVGASYSTNGPTSRVYIDGDLRVQSGRRINTNGSANEFILIVTGDLYIEKNVKINGYLYVSGNFYFEESFLPNYRTVINGGLSLSGQAYSDGFPSLFAPSINYQPPEEPLKGGNLCIAGNSSPPVTVPDHYRLSYSSPALTCEAIDVTVEACADASCSTYSSAAGSVRLSNSAGSWSPNPVVASPMATTELSQTEAGSYTLAVDNIQTSPGALNPTQCYVNGTFTSDCSITFNDIGLKFDSISTQTSGDSFLTNLSVVRTNDNTQACEVVAEQISEIDMGMHCINPGSCSDFGQFSYAQMSAKASDSVQGYTLLNELEENSPGSFTGWTPVTANFQAGQEELEVQYGDAGKVSLRATAELPNGKVIEGVSNEFVYKPASIGMETVSSYSGDILAKAGESFFVALQALNSDDQVTPNFGREVPQESLNLAVAADAVAPAEVSGELDNNSSFSAQNIGSIRFENDSVSYSEVGSAKVTAKVVDANYLGAGSVTTEHIIGRFIPFEFKPLTTEFIGSCTDFYYMGQEQPIEVSAEAVNASGDRTENYTGSLANATPLFYAYDSSEDELVAHAMSNDGTWLWNEGVGGFTGAASVIVSRLSSGQPDGPFRDYILGWQLDDQEGDNFYSTLHNSNLSAPHGSARLDTANLYYGRLNLQDSYAAIGDIMPVEGSIEYWDGSKFVNNPDDHCEVFDSDAHSFVSGSPEPTPLPAASLVKLENGELSPSSANIEKLLRWESQPANEPYQFNFQLKVPDYLKYDWPYNDDEVEDGSDYTDSPRAEGTFGIYRGRDRQIYWREIGW